MFRSLRGGIRLHGQAGSLVWAGVEAATVRGWTIQRTPKQPQWGVLTATVGRVHPFRVRQRPIYFSAPRRDAHAGFWCFGVESIDVGATQMIARLGPPEQ